MMNSYPIGHSKWELDTPALCLDAPALGRISVRMGRKGNIKLPSIPGL